MSHTVSVNYRAEVRMWLTELHIKDRRRGGKLAWLFKNTPTDTQNVSAAILPAR